MDKDFIKTNNLNEAVKRFQEIASYKSPKQSLNEYSFFGSNLVEDGENDANNQQQPNADMQQPQGGDMNMQQPQGGDMGMPQNAAPDVSNQGGDMNGQMGAEMPPEGAEMPQNGDMGMQQPPMNDGQAPMDGEQAPMDDGMGNDMGMMNPEDGIETEEMEPEDEVIDVDELTQSQEATEYKIDGVDDRLSKIFAVVKDFSDKLDKQEQSIIKLKDEFEKRNPTQTEKFNLRSQAGGPFNQTPTDYWDKLTQENPNYEIMRDNDISPSEEEDAFKIRKGDISGLNMKNISDTLNIDQNLHDYIGF